MRTKILVTALVLFVLMIATTPVSAQTNHSLEWGAEEGEQFTYVLQRGTYASEAQRASVAVELPYIANLGLGEKAVLTVEQLDLIPTQINSSLDMPIGRCNITRLNDSMLLGTGLQRLIIPVGDWSFLAEIGNVTGTPGLTLVDTSEEWGTIGRGSYQDLGGAIVNVYIEMRYEKENGTLNYMRYHYTSGGATLFDIIFAHWYPGMPTILPVGNITVTILIVALGSIIGIIVAVVTYRWYRGKKSLVQQLGE